jgi:hypothetical protein
MNKLLVVGLTAVSLAGCTAAGPKILTKTEILDRPNFVVPDNRVVEQYPLRWIVITSANVDKKLKVNPTIIGLTPSGYQNLSVNVAELRRYIKQQNAAIQAMKNYYEKKDKQ